MAAFRDSTRPAMGIFYEAVRQGGDLLGESVCLISNQKACTPSIIRLLIIMHSLQMRGKKPDAISCIFRHAAFKSSTLYKGNSEKGSHGGADHLGIKYIRCLPVHDKAVMPAPSPARSRVPRFPGSLDCLQHQDHRPLPSQDIRQAPYRLAHQPQARPGAFLVSAMAFMTASDTVSYR